MSHKTQEKMADEVEQMMKQHDLTEKQAAILLVFDQDPSRSYADIAEEASSLLPEEESVTGTYASEQIKQRRTEWFGDDGRRKSTPDEEKQEEGDKEEDATPFKRSDQAVPVTAPEEENVDSGDLGTVTMNENTWLRLVAYLHLYSNNQEKEERKEHLTKMINDITEQVLED